MATNELYTELIMMHNKSGHNHHHVNDATVVERGHNPNCGDDLTLELKLEKGVIVDAGFIGTGCAISKASMSIMIDLVKGKSYEEAKTLADVYLGMIRGDETSEEAKELLMDAAVFEGLKRMPARVKCGTLGWHCLKAAEKTLEKN